MNLCFSALLLFLLAFTNCSKSSYKKIKSSSNILVGKWTFTENYYSIGGPGEWHAVQPAGQTIEFKLGGDFKSSPSFSSTFNHYQIMDSAKVKFSPATTSNGYVLMKYEFDAAAEILILNPVEPICIEGCSYKFKRNSY